MRNKRNVYMCAKRCPPELWTTGLLAGRPHDRMFCSFNPSKGNNKADPNGWNPQKTRKPKTRKQHNHKDVHPKKQADNSEEHASAHKLYWPNSSGKFGQYSLFFRIVGLCFAVNVLMLPIQNRNTEKSEDPLWPKLWVSLPFEKVEGEEWKYATVIMPHQKAPKRWTIGGPKKYGWPPPEPLGR